MIERFAIQIIIGVFVAAGLFSGGYGCAWSRGQKAVAKAEADRGVAESQLRSLADQQAKTEKQLEQAQARAQDIRVVTTERIREVQATGIPPGCDAAMDFLRAEAQRIRNRKPYVVAD